MRCQNASDVFTYPRPQCESGLKGSISSTWNPGWQCWSLIRKPTVFLIPDQMVVVDWSLQWLKKSIYFHIFFFNLPDSQCQYCHFGWRGTLLRRDTPLPWNKNIQYPKRPSFAFPKYDQAHISRLWRHRWKTCQVFCSWTDCNHWWVDQRGFSQSAPTLLHCSFQKFSAAPAQSGRSENSRI